MYRINTVGQFRDFATEEGLSKLWGFGIKTVAEAYLLFEAIGYKIKKPGGKDLGMLDPLASHRQKFRSSRDGGDWLHDRPW